MNKEYPSDEEVSKRFIGMSSPFDFNAQLKINETIKKRGASHERAEMIEQLCTFMGEDNKRFKYWIGRTKKLSPAQIYELMQKAKNGKNPKALFQWFLKQK